MQFTNQYLRDYARQALQQAEQTIDVCQALKQCSGSMENYTFFHEKQVQAKKEQKHWQSFLNVCNQSIQVGSLVRPRTSAVKAIVLDLRFRQGRSYAQVQTLGTASQAPSKYCYYLEDLQLVQPDGHDRQRIHEQNLSYQPV